MRKYLLLAGIILWGAFSAEWTPVPDGSVVYAQVLEYQSILRADNVERQREVQRIRRALKDMAFEPISDSLATAVAVAIHKDAEITGLPHGFYIGLIRVENPWVDPTIVNWYGAVGLTQVVPRYHEGNYPECGTELRTDSYTQICYGTRYFMELLDRYEGDYDLALWAYNGCTPQRRNAKQRCLGYPTWVMQFASDFEELD